MSLEISLTCTATVKRGLVKRFLNPKRLRCASCPTRAALAMQGLLSLTTSTAATSADLAQELLSWLVQEGVGDLGAILEFEEGARRPTQVASFDAQGQPRVLSLDSAIVDFVLDCGGAVGSSLSRAEGVREVACVPLSRPGQVRTSGCLYLERRAGAEGFTTGDLDLLLVLARSFAGCAARLPQGSPRPRPASTRLNRPSRRLRPRTSRARTTPLETQPATRRAASPRRAALPQTPQGTTRFRVETHTSFGRPSRAPDPARPPKRVPLTLKTLFPNGVPGLPDFD